LHQNGNKKQYLKAQKPSKNAINASHSAQILAAVEIQELANRPNYMLPTVSYNNLGQKKLSKQFERPKSRRIKEIKQRNIARHYEKQKQNKSSECLIHE